MSTISNSPRIKEIADIIGDGAPHSMSELYGLNFSSGNAVLSGTLSLSGFRNKTPQVVATKEIRSTARSPRFIKISSDGSTAVLAMSSTTTPSVYVFEKINGEWVETAILTGNPTGTFIFGGSVAVSGDGSVVAIGSITYENAVYIFERPSSGWVSTSTYSEKLTYTRSFGNSVSISDNSLFLLIGVRGYSSPYTDAGGGFVYEKVGTNWIRRAILSSNTGINNDAIGEFSYISGNGSTVILCGTYNSSYRGLAYIYEKPSTGWTDTDQYAIKLTGSVNRVYFGISCCLSYDGLTAIVGAYRQDSDQGAAHIYEKINGTWSHRAKLTGEYFSLPAPRFGSSVFLSSDGTHAIVGAPEADNSSGRVYIFEKPTTGWVSTSSYKNKLSNNSATFMGYDVSMDSNKSKIFVSNNNRYGINYFHIYENLYTMTTQWEATGYRITGSIYHNYLGRKVAISGDSNTCAIGMKRTQVSPTAVYVAVVYTKTNGSWNSGTDVGSFSSTSNACEPCLSHDGNIFIIGDSAEGYSNIYTRSNGTWDSGTQITASAGGNKFGYSVTVSGDGSVIAVGSPHSDSYVGRVYIFRYTNSSWTEETFLTPSFSTSGSTTNFYFGESVSLSHDGNVLAVGAVGAPYNSVQCGAVLVFKYSGSSWSSTAEVGVSTLNISSKFGASVRLSGDGLNMVVGAPDTSVDNNMSAGLVYFFNYNSDNSSWGNGTELRQDPVTANSQFGGSLAINYTGTCIVAGSALEYYGYQIFESAKKNIMGDSIPWKITKVLDTPDFYYPYYGGSTSISDDGNFVVGGGLDGEVYVYERS